jgi:two-component system, OmpR family, sensor histidine kinase TctE
MKKPSSLRRQLWLWLIPVLAIWIASITIIYFFALDLARSSYDAELAEEARSLATRVQIKEGLVAVDLPPAASEVLTYDLSDQLFYQVMSSTGRIVAGDPSFPMADTAQYQPNVPVFRNEVIRGKPVRVVTFRIPVAERFAVVSVAETLSARQLLAWRILLTLSVPACISVLLMTAALFLAVDRSIAPLDAIRKSVERRSLSDLQPLPESNVPIEVAPLVAAINLLLARLREDIEMHKRFVSNAAHQLRTPLAGLHNQTELALAEQDPDERNEILKKVRIGAERSARVAQQLLTLARIDESVGHSTNIELKPVALEPLLTDCIESVLDSAMERDVEIGLDADQDYEVYGNQLLLREMVINLLDNAIRHSNPGAHVLVRVKEEKDRVALTVEDDGPGIPSAERTRVFERFYRAPGTNSSGTGLGLAIVQEIANAHDAQIQIIDPPSGGTIIKLLLPRVKPTGIR